MRGARVDHRVVDGVPGLVHDLALRHPDNVACVSDQEQITFGELDRRTDKLAVALAGEPTPVGLYLPRGPKITVAMLACLKAGRPFVPFSLSESESRLASMVPAARPGCLVASTAVDLPAPLADLPEPGSSAPPGPDRAFDPEESAYIMFTSGSTGPPKGVRVSHAALLNRLLWAREAFGLGRDDVALQKTPYTFDVALVELLGTVVAGARIHYLTPDAHHDPGAVIDAITQGGVTICHFVPAMLEEFLRWPGARDCQSLRHVLCSGEALRPDVVRAFARTLPARLHNLYGPTEATIDVTHWAVPDPAECERVYVGTPVSNTDVYVLDNQLAPVPAGEVGELCVAGIQVADGYVGRPDLTAQAFVRLADGTRVYRTGDRARIVSGLVEVLGRLDEQVKVRGVRVEPGETQRVIGGLDQVSQVAVVACDGVLGTRLVAFVTAPRPGAVSPIHCPVLAERGAGTIWRDPALTSAVVARVRAELPDAFVPARVYGVDRIPTSPTGKQDRTCLKEAAAQLVRDEAAGSPGAAEDELAELWAAALGAGPAPDAGFTEHGGDSLAAVRFVSSLYQARGHRIPLRWLLVDNLSLAQLRERLAASPAGSAPYVRTTGAGLSPVQRRLWFLGQLHGSLGAYNVVSGVRVAGHLPAELVEARLRSAVDRHEALRAQIVLDADGEPVQRVTAVTDPPLRTAEAGTEDYDCWVDGVMQRLQEQEFPLDAAPLVEVWLLWSADRSQTTVVVAGSHLVLDQYSVEILWDELLTEAAAAPVPPASEPAARAADRASALAYWRAELDGAPRQARLPFRKRTAGRPGYAGNTARRVVVAADADRLREVCRQHGLRPGSLVLAAFAATVVSWSDDAELVCGLPYDNRRSRADADRVGLFLDTLPIRIAPTPGQPLLRLAAAGQERVAAAAGQNGAGFEAVVADLAGPRDGVRSPIFQVWFNDVSAVERPVAVAGQVAARIRVPNPPALFELSLYLQADHDGALELRLTCAADLFEPPVAEALVEGVARMLHAASRDPQVRVAEALPVGEDPVPSPAPRLAGVSDLLHAFATRGQLDAVAIRYGTEEITYRELRARVAATTAGLASLAGPDRVLGLLASRNPDLAVALLGCWSAGLAPVVLDRELPAAYLDQVLADCGAGAAVATGSVPDLSTTVTTLAELPPGAGAAGPPSPVAHFLTTSGTAGRPKVVAVPSRAFVTALLGYAGDFGLGPADRFAFLAGPGHDPMFRDLLLPLLLGASTAVPHERAGPNPRALLEWLRHSGVTVLHLTPGRAELLVGAARAGRMQLPRVRLVLVGGCVLDWGTVAGLQRLCPAAEVANAYGTTEIAQVASVYRCPRAGPATGGVPVGTRAGGRHLVVVRDRRVAAPGQLGEIGVLEPHPVGHTLDGPLPTVGLAAGTAVLTGDLGRVDLDGQVVWCGRTDRQLSVDGYRVDQSEVEQRLRAEPGVTQALVVTRGVPQTLTAYAVCDDGDGPGRGEALRSALARSLPRWSVPDVIHIVPWLGLDRNGKPDAVGTAALVTPPAGPADQPDVDGLLQRLVQSYLPAPARLTDRLNFFDAGLGSFDLVRLLRDLHRAGYSQLRLLDLLESPNLRALSTTLRRRLAARAGAVAGPHRGAPASSMAERRRRLRERWRADESTRPESLGGERSGG